MSNYYYEKNVDVQEDYITLYSHNGELCIACRLKYDVHYDGDEGFYTEASEDEDAFRIIEIDDIAVPQSELKNYLSDEQIKHLEKLAWYYHTGSWSYTLTEAQYKHFLTKK
jgi:hypothetical protein